MRQFSKWAAVAVVAASMLSAGCKKDAAKPAEPAKPAAPAAAVPPVDPAAAPVDPAAKPADPAAPAADPAAAPVAPAADPAAAPVAPAADPAAAPVAPAADPAAAGAVDCEKAVDHMIALITADATIPADKKAEALAQSQTPEGRAKAIEGCKAAPAAITSCMLAAPDLKAAIGCQMQAAAAAQPPVDPNAPAAPPAADEGECGKATDHMLALLDKDTSIPAEAKTAMLASVRSAEGRKNAVDSCKKEAPETIKCVMEATEFKAAAECGKKAEAPVAPEGAAPAPAPEGAAPEAPAPAPAPAP
jgi:hypothetical protein